MKIPDVIKGTRLLIRGTVEWDKRELARAESGCRLLSFGTVRASLDTNGRSSLVLPIRK